MYASTRTVTSLDHVPFQYNITLQAQNFEGYVTVRIFICPTTEYLDHCRWIEMDKFKHHVTPSTLQITRKSEESTILERTNSGSGPVCGCGLPKNILLPRGNLQGMNFELFVIITKDDYNEGGTQDCCLDPFSSYCASANWNKNPDPRPLGYPFCRQYLLNNNDIPVIFAPSPDKTNWYTTNFTIKRDDARAPTS